MGAELVVVGGGRMGEALAGGVLSSGWAEAAGVVVVELAPRRREELSAGLGRRFPALTVTDEIPACAGAVLAVKPGDVEAACRSLSGSGVRRVLSIAAGVRLERLERWLGAPTDANGPREGPTEHGGPVVLRAMPNTPALIGAGASALSPGTAAGPDDVAWASGLLASVGTVTEVPERLLDAVTGLSGSGPAYVFLLVEALIDAGVLVGLDRRTARDLAVQTLLGSARLLAESGEGPESLRAGVTSPGGTTAAGLRALEAAGFRPAVMDAVVAATERSRQLGT
jgi:pyrroline-5-carboxylate reductase